MSGGITNLEIDKLFENEDIKKNYMGVYSIDSITRYIKFYIKKTKYPFAIFNTDKHNTRDALLEFS